MRPFVNAHPLRESDIELQRAREDLLETLPKEPECDRRAPFLARGFSGVLSVPHLASRS